MSPDTDINRTVYWMSKAIPNPTTKNMHTQLGVHFEEIAEMLDCITAKNPAANIMLMAVKAANKGMADYLKINNDVIEVKEENRINFLDGLCDQLVTATGVGYVYGMDIAGGFGEVNRSNFTKFDINGEPLLDNNLKVIKGPHYQKPNLEPFIKMV